MEKEIRLIDLFAAFVAAGEIASKGRVERDADGCFDYFAKRCYEVAESLQSESELRE